MFILKMLPDELHPSKQFTAKLAPNLSILLLPNLPILKIQ